MLIILTPPHQNNKQRGFYEACISGNEEVVQFFLENKEKYQIDLEWICLGEKKAYLFTAIELAARNEQIKIAKLLYQHNARHNNVNIFSIMIIFLERS